MKKLPLLLLPLALAACHSQDVQAPETYDLSGTLRGEWGTNARLRLALVGTGLPKVLTNDSTFKQNILAPVGNNRSFGMDLPTVPNVVGVYQVIAFDDANNNARYDVGETFARNRQWLIFSPTNTTTPAITLPADFPWAAGEEALPAMEVKRGWNVYDRAQQLSGTNPRPAGKITGYDIYR